MAIVKVSVKGQIVIPAELRKKYGIIPGNKVDIRDGNGKILIFQLPQDPIRKARGMLKGGSSLTQALLKTRAEDRQREETSLSR